MAKADSTATVVWKGDLVHGSGEVSVRSGALPGFPVTWASRTLRSQGKSSPEELIAAAHASCFSMALSNALAEAGYPPEQLTVSATVGFDFVQGVPTITASALEVTGRVPDMEAAAFIEAAEAAKDGCPVSRALRGNVDISLAARLV